MGLFKKIKSNDFYNAMEERRSIYNLKDSISISDDELESMIAHAVKHVPSSFNSQSTRIVLSINNNNKFWDNTKAILKEVMGEIVISSQLNKKLITSNIHTVQFCFMKIKML